MFVCLILIEKRKTQKFKREMHSILIIIFILPSVFVQSIVSLAGKFEWKFFLVSHEENEIFNNGILKVNFILINESYHIEFTSLSTKFTNDLCSTIGYDNIHSLTYPCKISSTEKYIYKISPANSNSCCKLYVNFCNEIFI